MNFGLTKRDIKHIIEAVSQFPEIDKVIIFGSRAMGNFKRGSDVDIALKGTGITHSIITRLSSLLNEEQPLPYFFDVLHYETLQNEELKKHIDTEGREITIDIKQP
jgi:uncharacterized protein